MPTSLTAASSYPLPAATAGQARFDVIMLHPDGTKAVETFFIDAAAHPTERERYVHAMAGVADAIRALYAWKKAGGT